MNNYLTRSDIDRFERDGAYALAMPIGKERMAAIQSLCQRIKKAEPKAFEAAADYISKELPKVPLKAFGETEAKSFSQWWRLRIGWCKLPLEWRRPLSESRMRELEEWWPLRESRMKEIKEVLEGSELVVSWPYSMEAIGIYMALKSEVHGLMGDSAVDKRLTTEKAKKMFGFLHEYIEETEGGKLVWLKGSKTDFVCFVREAQVYLGAGSEWSMFEKSFDIHDNKFSPKRLQSYSSKPNVSNRIEDNEGCCGNIKALFARNSK